MAKNLEERFSKESRTEKNGKKTSKYGKKPQNMERFTNLRVILAQGPC